jgi:mitogen-activated protein kinase 1/3
MKGSKRGANLGLN